jgi:regulator of sigma D
LEGNGQLLKATKIWPLLEANTQLIMDYYDSSLETAIDHDNFLEFQKVLSDLGEALEARFVLEDKLIMLVFDAMHEWHSQTSCLRFVALTRSLHSLPLR